MGAEADGRMEPEGLGNHKLIAWMPKHLRVLFGFLLLIAGGILALPLVPGPGVALILLGLVILSRDFRWARRLLDWGRQKWRNLRPPD